MKHRLRLIALFFLLIGFSCSRKQEIANVTTEAALEKSADAGSTKVTEVNSGLGRKIIKEGEIVFETTDLNETRKMISKSISDFEGYVSNEHVVEYDDKIEQRITIRVPADKFELLLEKITETAGDLDSRSINALDVTEEFIDVEARIRNKKELEGRYKELLKRANKVDEILEIEKEMGSLRSDIESIEGRLNYLRNKVSYSTLTIVFYERASSSFGFYSKFGQALKNGWNNMLWFFIGLTNLWPFILIALLVFIIFRRLTLSNRKKKAT